MNKTKINIAIDMIKQQIANKSLIAGSRLPSVRQLAIQLNFSVSTIVEAYTRLVSAGVLESRIGAGYFVVGQATQTQIFETKIQYQREIDPLWISRQSLEAKPDVLKPGCGWLPSHWMPEQTIRKALKQVAKSEISFMTDYAVPNGHLALRQWIARRKQNYDLSRVC